MDQDLDLEVPELSKDGLSTQVGFGPRISSRSGG